MPSEIDPTKEPGILDLLSDQQRARLTESIQQADDGKVKTHEEVIRISREWLQGSSHS